MERLRAWREKKRQERVMTSSPTPPPVSLPQSPLPRDIPQLDGDVSISNDGRDAEDQTNDAVDRSDHVVNNVDATDRRDDAIVGSDDAVDLSDPADESDALDPSPVTAETGTLLPPTTGAALRTEGTASKRLETGTGSPQQLCRPPPRKVYNPAGRKHIPQNPLYKTPTYK